MYIDVYVYICIYLIRIYHNIRILQNIAGNLIGNQIYIVSSMVYSIIINIDPDIVWQPLDRVSGACPSSLLHNWLASNDCGRYEDMVLHARELRVAKLFSGFSISYEIWIGVCVCVFFLVATKCLDSDELSIHWRWGNHTKTKKS